VPDERHRRPGCRPRAWLPHRPAPVPAAARLGLLPRLQADAVDGIVDHQADIDDPAAWLTAARLVEGALAGHARTVTAHPSDDMAVDVNTVVFFNAQEGFRHA